jgi:hypothetical protein
MTMPKAGLVAITAALLTPQFAVAQLASRIEAGGLITDASGQSAIPVSIWRIAPAASFTGSHGSLTTSTSAWLDNQNWQLVDGSVGGTLIAPTIYGVRTEFIGNASRAFDDRSLGTDQVDVQTRVTVPFNKQAGAWLGGGVARPWRVMVVSSVDLLNGGAWVDLGATTFTATVTSFSFNRIAGGAADGDLGACSTASAIGAAPPPIDGTTSGGGSTATCRTNVVDETITGHWTLDRIELAGEAGHRSGLAADVMHDPHNWGSGTVTMWVAPRAAIVAGGGVQPSNPARGIPARSFGTLGMVLSYLSLPRNSVPLAPTTAAVRSFDARSGDDGMQKITVRVGGVESVDVAGDFSDWGPLTMVRRGRDVWELLVPINSGIHQINIRTDGGRWVAPPGLPTTKDMFNGEVGILIVRP